MSNGGTVSSTNGLIGWNQGSTGSATVTGAGSTWTNAGVLNVGRDGTGTLAVSDGGRVSNTDGAIGDVADSIGNAMVTGANSIWANNGALYVGAQGTGALTVRTASTVRQYRRGLGLSSAAIGNATVTGTNSTWANSGTLQVGRSGTGTLMTVQDGGTASNTDGLLGLFSGASGHATVTARAPPGPAAAASTSAWRCRWLFANGGQVSVNGGVGVLHVAELSRLNRRAEHRCCGGQRSAEQRKSSVAAGELRFAAGTGRAFNHTDAAYVFGTRITIAGVLKPGRWHD